MNPTPDSVSADSDSAKISAEMAAEIDAAMKHMDAQASSAAAHPPTSAPRAPAVRAS
jgi:hypothetical protein